MINKEKKKIPFQAPTKEEVEAYFDRLMPFATIHKDGTVTYSPPLESVKPLSISQEEQKRKARYYQFWRETEEEWDNILKRAKAPSAKQRTNLAEVDKRSLIDYVEEE